MHVCVGVFGQVMGCRWESGSDLEGKDGDFRWFHLLLLSPTASLLPGGVISGECPDTQVLPWVVT